MAAADVKANLEADGDAVTLIAPDATEYELTGWAVRVDEVIDPDTGAKIYDPRTVVTVPTADLPADSPTEGWTVETTDGTGTAITGRVMAPRYDRTMRFVRFEVEIFDEVESG
jgi:hypothetical protein